jgi:hypothetical protein
MNGFPRKKEPHRVTKLHYATHYSNLDDLLRRHRPCAATGSGPRSDPNDDDTTTSMSTNGQSSDATSTSMTKLEIKRQ